MTILKRRLRVLESKQQDKDKLYALQADEEIDEVQVYSTGEKLTKAEFDSKYPDGVLIVIRYYDAPIPKYDVKKDDTVIKWSDGD